MKLFSITLIAILISSCAVQPYNVPKDASGFSDKPSAGDNITFDDAKKNIIKHAQMYGTKSNELSKLASKNGEGTFYSSLVAVVGGVFSNKTLAIGGATGAAGTSMFSERYKLEVQSNHYRVVATALECVYAASEPVMPELTPGFTFQLPPETTELVAMNYVRDVAVKALYKARIWIENAQLNMALGTPSIDALKNALSQLNPTTVKTSTTNSKLTTYYETLYDPRLEQEDRQKNYKKEVDICLSQLTP